MKKKHSQPIEGESRPPMRRGSLALHMVLHEASCPMMTSNT